MGLRERSRTRLRHVIVDEYQDVDPIPEAVARLLHELGATVCVVDDDDQTIYHWHGSDVDNILTFGERHPGFDRIGLVENFRSSEDVVALVRDFIRQVTRRLPKDVKATTAQAYETGDVVALPVDTREDEAACIAASCRALRGLSERDGEAERGISWSDMAVLLRSVRRDGGPIMAAREAAGMPHVITGKDNLFARPEAKAWEADLLCSRGRGRGVRAAGSLGGSRHRAAHADRLLVRTHEDVGKLVEELALLGDLQGQVQEPPRRGER